jgi:hypothetical protein
MFDSSKTRPASNPPAKSVSKNNAVTFEEIGYTLALEGIYNILCIAGVIIDLERQSVVAQLRGFFEEDPMLTFRSMCDRVDSFWENHPSHRNIWWD